jgi:predicted acyl esterase
MTHTRLVVERDAEVRMRDGVILRADVYRPDALEPVPVLMLRTPYGKAWSETSFALTAAERGVCRGYPGHEGALGVRW